MVYVTAFVPPGRGFKPSIMPKLSPFWLFYMPWKNDDRDGRHPNPAMNHRELPRVDNHRKEYNIT